MHSVLFTQIKRIQLFNMTLVRILSHIKHIVVIKMAALIIELYYIERITKSATYLVRCKIHFTQTRHSIPAGVGWLPPDWSCVSCGVLARSLGNWYSRNVLRDFLTWVAILIGLCSSILPAHWMTDFGQKFAKLSWNWKMLTSFHSYSDGRGRSRLWELGVSPPPALVQSDLIC